MDHAREKPPFVTRSFLLHGKSLLAMIGPEAKIGTSAIPFHLTTLVPPRTDATTNDVPQFHRRFFPPPLSFRQIIRIPLPREEELRGGRILLRLDIGGEKRIMLFLDNVILDQKNGILSSVGKLLFDEKVAR